MRQLIRSHSLSPAVPLLNRQCLTAADDDVIEHRDADYLRDLLQLLRHADILIAGCRIAGRMVVDGNEDVCGIPDGCPEYLPRMDKAIPKRAHRNLVTLDRPIFRVQCDDPEFFLLAMCQISKPIQTISLRGRRRANSEALLGELPERGFNSIAKLNCGRQSLVFGLRNASDSQILVRKLGQRFNSFTDLISNASGNPLTADGRPAIQRF
jgi:hypothetical protein